MQERKKFEYLQKTDSGNGGETQKTENSGFCNKEPVVGVKKIFFDVTPTL